MILVVLMLACGGEAEEAPAAQIAPSTYDTGGPLCDDPPVVTWENFGQGFLLENCQSCHGSDSPYRDNAAPEDVPPISIAFDTHDAVIALKDLILSSATGSDPRMPPSDGISALDRKKLAIWLTCWEED